MTDGLASTDGNPFSIAEKLDAVALDVLSGIQPFHSKCAVERNWLGKFHFEHGMLVLRVEAQNFTNHDNLGPLDINLLDIGTPAYMNRSNASEPMDRHLLLWAKYRF